MNEIIKYYSHDPFFRVINAGSYMSFRIAFCAAVFLSFAFGESLLGEELSGSVELNEKSVTIQIKNDSKKELPIEILEGHVVFYLYIQTIAGELSQLMPARQYKVIFLDSPGKFESKILKPGEQYQRKYEMQNITFMGAKFDWKDIKPDTWVLKVPEAGSDKIHEITSPEGKKQAKGSE